MCAHHHLSGSWATFRNVYQYRDPSQTAERPLNKRLYVAPIKSSIPAPKWWQRDGLDMEPDHIVPERCEPRLDILKTGLSLPVTLGWCTPSERPIWTHSNPIVESPLRQPLWTR
jgi:hypothetical protein